MKIPYIKIYTADLLAKTRRLSPEQIGEAIIGLCEQAFENQTEYEPKNEAEKAFFNLLLDWKNESVSAIKQKRNAGRKGAKVTNEKRKLSDGGTAVLSADGTPKRQTETETETEVKKEKLKKEKKSASTAGLAYLTATNDTENGNGTGNGNGIDDGKEKPQFADFWEQYPKKTTKKECLDWWRKNPDKRQLAINGLEFYKRNTDPQYYLDPIRYLKRERWQDMPENWQKPMPKPIVRPEEDGKSAAEIAKERAEQERWDSLTEEQRKAELDAYLAETGGPWQPPQN